MLGLTYHDRNVSFKFKRHFHSQDDAVRLPSDRLQRRHDRGRAGLKDGDEDSGAEHPRSDASEQSGTTPLDQGQEQGRQVSVGKGGGVVRNVG